MTTVTDDTLRPQRGHGYAAAAVAWLILALAATGLVVPLAATDHGDVRGVSLVQHAPAPQGQHQGHSDQGHGNDGHGDHAQAGAEHADNEDGSDHDDGGHGHTTKPLLEMTPKEIFFSFYTHLMPHLWSEELAFFDVNAFQVLAVVLIFLIFLPVLMSFGVARPNAIIRVFRGFCLWIRDEIVYSIMGAEEGRQWLPFFLYMFFFIAFANLFGLIPNSVTATATVFVTGALALITFVTMIGGGMAKQGPVNFWKNLIPHGVPAPMIALLFPLECLGLLVKPFALAIRLFANMLAGHLVLYSFLGLIFLFAKLVEQSLLAYPLALPGLGLAIFIFIIESFVALLQAYVFTLLSCIFIQQALHPDH